MSASLGFVVDLTFKTTLTYVSRQTASCVSIDVVKNGILTKVTRQGHTWFRPTRRIGAVGSALHCGCRGREIEPHIRHKPVFCKLHLYTFAALLREAEQADFAAVKVLLRAQTGADKAKMHAEVLLHHSDCSIWHNSACRPAAASVMMQGQNPRYSTIVHSLSRIVLIPFWHICMRHKPLAATCKCSALCCCVRGIRR